MISPTTIEQIKELSIVDVIGNYVDIKKVGTAYRGKSPFTNEKSASFYVVPVRNFFKDFSSGKGGSAITFVMEHESISYVQAIERIAKDHNITVEYERNGLPKEHYDEIAQLYTINQATARRYAEALFDLKPLEVPAPAYLLKEHPDIKPTYIQHPVVSELINKRRFTPDTIAQWQIGYAPGDVTEGYTPSKWNFLSRILIEKGLYKQGEELGLIKTKDGVNYDSFRHRIIFPIIDHLDRFVGFGARALQTDKYNAKYLNSSDCLIFTKGKVLFGLNFAGKAIKKQGYANLMEGFTDVISFHQSGINNTVGTCGTALTEDQCKLLKEYTNKVVMINDPDEAGQNATVRNIDLLMKFGFQTSVIPLPSIVQCKRNKPTPEDLNPQPFRELVWIYEREHDYIKARYQDEEKVFLTKEIEVIEKLDPDEFSRMFMPKPEAV